jgi:uncharacterized protein YecA (UPF0149 family)
MVWGFLKDKISKIKGDDSERKFEKKSILSSDKIVSQEKKSEPVAKTAKTGKKESWDKTDDEVVEELNKISPEILAQAKTPKMRKIIIDVYKKMLKDGVNVNKDREVKKWLKKHPQALQGGEDQKIETFKRTEDKICRNSPCPCGSGKKYKKCCGK